MESAESDVRGTMFWQMAAIEALSAFIVSQDCTPDEAADMAGDAADALLREYRIRLQATQEVQRAAEEHAATGA